MPLSFKDISMGFTFVGGFCLVSCLFYSFKRYAILGLQGWLDSPHWFYFWVVVCRPGVGLLLALIFLHPFFVHQKCLYCSWAYIFIKSWESYFPLFFQYLRWQLCPKYSVFFFFKMVPLAPVLRTLQDSLWTTTVYQDLMANLECLFQASGKALSLRIINYYLQVTRENNVWIWFCEILFYHVCFKYIWENIAYQKVIKPDIIKRHNTTFKTKQLCLLLGYNLC